MLGASGIVSHHRALFLDVIMRDIEGAQELVQPHGLPERHRAFVPQTIPRQVLQPAEQPEPASVRDVCGRQLRGAAAEPPSAVVLHRSQTVQNGNKRARIGANGWRAVGSLPSR